MRVARDRACEAGQPDHCRLGAKGDRNRHSPTPREATLEAELIETRAQLRARDESLAIAAHELRNPMTPIAAWVELLTTQARRRSGHISREILNGLERLEYLVNAYIRRATTLLDVSRINTGNLQLAKTEIDLSSLVRETVSAMIPAAKAAGCALYPAVQDGVSGRFDRTAVEQVIENIVSNAIRYGAGQPISVQLIANGNLVRLAVSDQGIGISEADQARILINSRGSLEVTPLAGSGLVLRITNQLVLAMGGGISVASKLGAGSTFTGDAAIDNGLNYMDLNQNDRFPSRIASGVPGLDAILHGGFLKDGVYIIQGSPGSGKTILANQICFHHARNDGCNSLRDTSWPRATPGCRCISDSLIF